MYGHPALGWMMDHWFVAIVLSGVLLFAGALALITRWSFGKDEAARLATYRRVDRADA